MCNESASRFSWFSVLKKSFPVALLLALWVSTQGCALDTPQGSAKVAAKKTYRNPLMEKWDMADPHVIRVGKKYYLYPTSHTHGYDALVSEDLVHWDYKGNIFKDPRGGDWAPDVFHNKRGDGKFYLYYTDNLPDGDHSVFSKQIGVAVADSPLGPFIDKGSLCHPSIDAHLFQDEDGSFYLYYVDLSQGSRIMMQPMADLLTKKGEPSEVIRPTEEWERKNGEVTEGPFMLKRNGVYYLMYSGTGADSPNYGIGYATAKSPLGPFEKYKGNPIVKRTDKVLGPGHHSVVEAPDGKLWMMYHQKRSEEISFKRFLAVDPIWFDDEGVIHATVSLRENVPAP
ncbi:MAG: Arabinoxylan arabinofuranohydrolase [Verrucomicrobiales bacterium]|nr:Arabinoxylan arabinofuranohydrolase [Verrucomicrobiales bacterium]